jgi:WD40 repeat protein
MRIWDRETGREIRVFKDFDHFVVLVSFTPDGDRVVSVERDNTISLWDAKTGKLYWKAKENSGEQVLSVVCSPDGRYIATADSGGKVILRDAITGKIAHAFAGKGDIAIAVLFSGDGKYLLMGSNREKLLWDVATETLQVHYKNSYTPLSFSPDGEHMLCTTGSKEKTLFTVETDKKILTLTGDFRSYVFSPDARYLVAGNSDGGLSVAEVKKQTKFITKTGHSGSVTALVFSPDGQTFASGSLDKTIKLWDFGTFGVTASSESLGFVVDEARLDFIREETVLITIIAPDLKSGDAVFVKSESVRLSGRLSNKKKASAVTVNGREVPVSDTGEFNVELPLKYGRNNIIIRAKLFAGSTVTSSCAVIRETDKK